MFASVIIPAHNEQAVIARTLEPLAPAARAGRLDVVVVCNACADDTMEVAAGFDGIRVIDSDIPSKTAAMNLGDDAARAWPRFYLDADIVASEAALSATAHALDVPGTLAARPRARYDTSASSPIVRAYYRARGRMPSLHRALWGAGIYALSAGGHRRIGAFPAVTGDDLWVDRAFASHEKTIVETDPVVVSAPRTLRALRAITRRNVAGSDEPPPLETASEATATLRQTLAELAASVRDPRSAYDAAVYAGVAASARMTPHAARWERDDTSRV